MIDYDKLKAAVSLAHRARSNRGCIIIDFTYPIGSDGQPKPYYNLGTEDYNGVTDEFEFHCIDALLDKLYELAGKNASYKVGQIVWKLNDKHAPQSYVIEQVDEESIEKYTIDDDEGWYKHEELWPNMQSLVKHWIEYWTKQAVKDAETPGECDHTYVLLTDDPACIKCGKPYADDCEHEYEHD